jgi:hypothetical protein
MADGSLRIECEVEPNDAQAAFALFGRPGAPMAIAALTPGYAIPKADMGNPMAEPKPRREQGDLEMKAILWCQSPEFWKFLTNGGCRVRDEAEAKALILSECDIDSRRQLDSEPAKSVFLKKIVGPFYKWNLARGLA